MTRLTRRLAEESYTFALSSCVANTLSIHLSVNDSAHSALKLTIMVIAALFPTVSDERSSPIYHPLSFGPRRVLAGNIRANANADYDVTLDFLVARISLAIQHVVRPFTTATSSIF